MSSSGSHAAAAVAAASSKVLDVSNMEIVHRGRQWDRAEDPCAKSVIHLLERNESLITWLQPKGGKVEDQVPAINVNGKYYCPLSLRMQKSIWRHIRLRKGFVNLERLSQGGYKLKIPTMLLTEKERTRSRFAQMRKSSSSSSAASASAAAAKDLEEDEEEEEEEPAAAAAASADVLNKKRGKKSPPSSSPSTAGTPLLAKNVCSALQEDILSLCGDAGKGLLPAFTDFVLSEESNLQYLVQQMRRECPNLCKDKEELVFQRHCSHQTARERETTIFLARVSIKKMGTADEEALQEMFDLVMQQCDRQQDAAMELVHSALQFCCSPHSGSQRKSKKRRCEFISSTLLSVQQKELDEQDPLCVDARAVDAFKQILLLKERAEDECRARIRESKKGQDAGAQALRDRMVGLESSLQEAERRHTQEVQALRDRMVGLESSLHAAVAARAPAEKELAEARALLEEERKGKAAAEKRLAEAQKSLEGERKGKAAADRKLAEAQKSFAEEKEASRTLAEKRLSVAEQEIADVSRLIADEKASRTLAEKQVAELKKSLVEEKEASRSLAETLKKSLAEEKEASRTLAETLKKSLAEEKEASRTLAEKQIAELKKSLADEKASRTLAEKQIAELKKSLADEKASRTLAEKRLAVAEQEVIDARKLFEDERAIKSAVAASEGHTTGAYDKEAKNLLEQLRSMEDKMEAVEKANAKELACMVRRYEQMQETYKSEQENVKHAARQLEEQNTSLLHQCQEMELRNKNMADELSRRDQQLQMVQKLVGARVK